MPANYLVVYHPAVVHEDIPKLDRSVGGRIKQAIEQKLIVAPATFGVPLRHSLQGFRKLRVGDYRVVVRVVNDTVYVLVISHRRVVYDQAERRA